MSFEKNALAGNEGTAGNLLGGATNNIANMTQAAFDAGAGSDILADADAGHADADLDQEASAQGSSDNISFGSQNVNF